MRGSALVLFAVTANYLFSNYRLQAPIFKIPASYALGSLVKLADRRECSFCNYKLLQGFILYRNLFDFLLRLGVLKRLGFQSQKYGIPIYTNIIKFYAVCF